jgi:hypothetical protein
MLRAFVNCTVVLKKRLNFFFFQWSKVDQVRSGYTSQLSKLMVYLAIEKKEALSYFKGLSLDGGRADFSKSPPRRFL